MTATIAQQILVGTTAVKLVSAIPQGQQVILSNKDTTNSFFCGPPSVTTASGVEVKPGAFLAQAPFELPPETEIWAIASAANVRADVFTIQGT